MLESFISENVAKKNKKEAGNRAKVKTVKKKNPISVDECSTSKKKNKGKRGAIEIYSKPDTTPVKKKRKVKIQNEDESTDSEMAVVSKKSGIKKEVQNNGPKAITCRMSPRSLQKVLAKLRTCQVEELERMGFGHFYNNFNFYSTPTILGMWVVQNFDSKTCSIKMTNGRKIKITRELVRDMLGIPMGDIKVEALEEKNLYEETTVKWRELLESIVVEKKIYIGRLEEHLCSLTEVDWEFRVCFLVLFFSIFGQGNKDGQVNERIIPILSNTNNVSQMDWCSYVLECMLKECTGFKPTSKFSGPLLLLAVSFPYLVTQ